MQRDYRTPKWDIVLEGAMESEAMRGNLLSLAFYRPTIETAKLKVSAVSADTRIEASLTKTRHMNGGNIELSLLYSLSDLSKILFNDTANMHLAETPMYVNGISESLKFRLDGNVLYADIKGIEQAEQVVDFLNTKKYVELAEPFSKLGRLIVGLDINSTRATLKLSLSEESLLMLIQLLDGNL